MIFDLQVTKENLNLQKKIRELESDNAVADKTRQDLVRQQQQNAVEILTLKKACQLQKKDLDDMEEKNKDLQDELHHNKIEHDERVSELTKKFESEKAELVEHYTGELHKQEEIFLEERTKIKEQLHEVTSNEVNLLNRIKCLEAEEVYSHAEVERILIKEREMDKKHQVYMIVYGTYVVYGCMQSMYACSVMWLPTNMKDHTQLL